MGSGLCKLVNDAVERRGDPSPNPAQIRVKGEGKQPPNPVHVPVERQGDPPPNPVHVKVKETGDGAPNPFPRPPHTEFPLIKGMTGMRRFGISIKVPRPKKKSVKIPPEPGLPVTCIAHAPKRFARARKRHRNPFRSARASSLTPPESGESQPLVSRKQPIVYSIHDAAVRKEKLSLRRSQPYWIRTKIADYLADAKVQAKEKLQRKSHVKPITVSNTDPSGSKAKTKTPVTETSTPDAEFIAVRASQIKKLDFTVENPETSSPKTTVVSWTQNSTGAKAEMITPVAETSTPVRALAVKASQLEKFTFTEENAETPSPKTIVVSSTQNPSGTTGKRQVTETSTLKLNSEVDAVKARKIKIFAFTAEKAETSSSKTIQESGTQKMPL
ncbi:hypothetical protein R1flu_011988 [Riccia fluitans]|uniref:Uncharacterized protein n=1 Tax=Riccia fluitans TaxID=41844 RepID=A0ABD1Z9P7_9MARC